MVAEKLTGVRRISLKNGVIVTLEMVEVDSGVSTEEVERRMWLPMRAAVEGESEVRAGSESWVRKRVE